MTEPRDVIGQEIKSLSVFIALLKYDYADAVLTGKPVIVRLLIADELASLQHQKKCLETKNFKALPYNIKLLYNADK